MKLLFIPEFFGVSIEVYVILLILGIPVFFFWRWFFKRYIETEKTRKISTWVTTIITTPLIYIGLFLIWILSVYYYPNHDFDKEKWFSDSDKRYEMSGDIIESQILIGKTKAEVREMLGDEENTENSDYWRYYLGFKPDLISIDPDILDIDFKHEKVIQVGQHTYR
ncbi:MAG: hypothetical protein KF900_14635 [Bacteroidetes bacterium]|nr:hypothetical protein [Bacteroidota bacterium]